MTRLNLINTLPTLPKMPEQMKYNTKPKYPEPNIMTTSSSNPDSDQLIQLLTLGVDCAQIQLQHHIPFQPAYIYQGEAGRGISILPGDTSNAAFAAFIEGLRLMAVAHNVCAGALVITIVSRQNHVPGPDQEYVLVIAESRQTLLSQMLPVNRSVDGKFSGLGKPIGIASLGWLPNIVPKQEPDPGARLAAKNSLELNKVAHFEAPPVEPNLNPQTKE
jgi:hypothetical protein